MGVCQTLLKFVDVSLTIFRTASRADDRSTRLTGPLDSVMTDASGTTCHENRLAIDRTIGEDTAMCGHNRCSQAGADLEADVPENEVHGLDDAPCHSLCDDGNRKATGGF